MPHSDAPQRSPRRTPATVAVIVALLAVAIVSGRWQDRDPASDVDGTGMVAQVVPASTDLAALATAPEPGALAPNFRLSLAGGGEIELAELRGRPVFVNFWASWCFFCLTEMPAIQRVAAEYGDEVVVLGVNVSDTPADIATYAGNNGLDYPFPMDTGGSCGRPTARARCRRRCSSTRTASSPAWFTG